MHVDGAPGSTILTQRNNVLVQETHKALKNNRVTDGGIYFPSDQTKKSNDEVKLFHTIENEETDDPLKGQNVVPKLEENKPVPYRTSHQIVSQQPNNQNFIQPVSLPPEMIKMILGFLLKNDGESISTFFNCLASGSNLGRLTLGSILSVDKINTVLHTLDKKSLNFLLNSKKLKTLILNFIKDNSKRINFFVIARLSLHYGRGDAPDNLARFYAHAHFAGPSGKDILFEIMDIFEKKLPKKEYDSLMQHLKFSFAEICGERSQRFCTSILRDFKWKEVIEKIFHENILDNDTLPIFIRRACRDKFGQIAIFNFLIETNEDNKKINYIRLVAEQVELGIAARLPKFFQEAIDEGKINDEIVNKHLEKSKENGVFYDYTARIVMTPKEKAAAAALEENVVVVPCEEEIKNSEDEEIETTSNNTTTITQKDIVMHNPPNSNKSDDDDIFQSRRTSKTKTCGCAIL